MADLLKTILIYLISIFTIDHFTCGLFLPVACFYHLFLPVVCFYHLFLSIYHLCLINRQDKTVHEMLYRI